MTLSIDRCQVLIRVYVYAYPKRGNPSEKTRLSGLLNGFTLLFIHRHGLLTLLLCRIVGVRIFGLPLSARPPIDHEQRLPRPDAVHQRQANRHEGDDDERERGRGDGEGDAEHDSGQDDLRDGVAVDAAPCDVVRQRGEFRNGCEEVADALEHRVDGERLVAHEEEESSQHRCLRQTKEALERWRDEDQNEGRLDEVRVSLLVCPRHEARLVALSCVVALRSIFALIVHKGFGMERSLGKEAVGRRDAQNAAHNGGRTQEEDVPGKSSWLADAVALDGADNAADLMVEVEEDGDDGARDDGQEHPLDRDLPELDEERRPLGARGAEAGLDVELDVLEGPKLADVRDADPEDDGDGGGVLGQAQAHVAMEERLPSVSGGQENGEEAGADGTDDGVEKGCEVGPSVGTLELAGGLVEVDDTVKEGEDVAAEVRHVLHGPVVGVEDGQRVVHPAGVDERPCHDGQEGDLEVNLAQLIDVLSQDGEGASDAEDGQWLG